MAMNIKAVTTCLGYQQITDLSSAVGLTVPTLAPDGSNQKPTFALIICETQGVRWRDDSTAPTASIGMPLAAGVPLQYDGDLNKIKFIQQTASAKLNISYYC
jgi:hypothetical protein|tara:strand:- start:88 stop:393 length:306 start_codon:yes stop_codon:yes gene_type:complete